jgi:HAD superfamily hydrolase (TIGR01509 family)
MKYKALLFDLDGTLVETVGLYAQAVIRTFKEHGHEVTEDGFHDFYTGGSSIEDWFQNLSVPQVMPETFRPRRDEIYMKILSEHSEYVDGALDLLAHTKAVPRAIVTGSWKKYVDAIHSKIGVQDHFEHIVCCDDMGMGLYMKPHPHGLFVACQRLGIEPEECLMIGDQTFDTDAAKAAGMDSCLIWGTHTPKHAAGTATHEVQSLKELQKLLR